MPIRRAFILNSVLALWWFIPFLKVSAALSNVTVDDSSSAISYSPASQWSQGATCSFCEAQPDKDKAVDNTWHDATFPAGGAVGDLRTASLSFFGAAVYVFCIVPHSLDHPMSNSDMTFILDGNTMGSFSLTPSTPDGEPNYDYSVAVYASDTIPNGPHSLTIQNGRVDGAQSLILLDYILYSQEEDVVTPSPQPLLTSSRESTSATTTSSTPETSSSALMSLLLPSTGSDAPPSSLSPLPGAQTIVSTVDQQNQTSTITVLAQGVSSSAVGSSQQISSSPASGNGDFVQARNISQQTRTIIIAASVAGTVVLLACIAAIYFYLRRRRRDPPVYPYDRAQEPDLVDDPGSSGWAEDAWGRQAEGGALEHPSLVPTKDSEGGIRGDLSTRERGRGRRDGSTRNRGLAESMGAPEQFGTVSEWSHSQRPSTGSTAVESSSIELAKIRTHRHPYASRTPEPDMDPPDVTDFAIREESNESEYDKDASIMPDLRPTPEPARTPSPRLKSDTTLSTPTLESAPIPALGPPPELPHTRIPMRPVLESQANAARLRRQNSTNISTLSGGDIPPPPYEISRQEQR